MNDTFDAVLRGGTVLDPASRRCERLDVGITGGRIAALEPSLGGGAKQVLDVGGCYVTPGLIDFHVHSYGGVNPYGFDADPVCTAGGVTTAVDAGSSGPVNFPGFERYVAGASRTRMLAFVCVAQHGVLHAPGELNDLRFADPEGSARTVAEHPEVAVGIKVRLHRGSVGDHGREALRLALQAGAACRAPVMVHIGETGISIEEIVGTLRPGDIVTHCYTPKQPTILDAAGHLRPAVRAARERGLLFDVGHANGHFDFDLVRRAMGEGLVPHTISSDLHGRIGASNPIVDLPTTMTKFLALGMSLEAVIAACTLEPARAIGHQKSLGCAAVGRDADLTVLEIIDEPVRLRDSVGGELVSKQRIAARWTIRGGAILPAKDFAKKEGK